jgi:trehalose transport system permease protein
VGRVAFVLWITACVVLVLFPVYLVFVVSATPGTELFGERPALLPHHPTLAFWRQVLGSGELWAPLGKSLSVASLTALAAVAIGAPGAYAICRLPSRLRHHLVLGLLAVRMFPDFVIGVSVATRFARLGLTDSHLGLVLAHLIGSLPLVAWILVATFEAIPPDLEEAAVTDGASRMAALGKVILPPAAGGIAVAGLLAWLYSWNEFLYARLLTTHDNTLPLQVFQAIDRGSRQHMATIAAVLTLPILAIVFAVQRHLRPGALAGAVKG